MPITPFAPHPAAELLLGKGRRELLALLLLHPGERFFVRQLARLTGASAGTTQRELRALEQVGLVRSEPHGRQVRFEADEASPLFPTLRTFLEHTVGAPDLIRAALAPLADQLAFAVIHGAIAAGTADADTGVDLLVVGDVDAGEVCDALAPTAPRLGRPVYAGVSTSAGFEALAAAKPHFVTAVLGGPFIPLIGEPPHP